jgi:hypothetical protein
LNAKRKISLRGSFV